MAFSPQHQPSLCCALASRSPFLFPQEHMTDNVTLLLPCSKVDMKRECRSVDEFERINKISEGTYGVVYKVGLQPPWINWSQGREGSVRK